MDEHLKTDKQEDCWTFTLSRPEKRNALSAALVEALIVQIDAAHEAGVPLMVFRGEGKNLSAGFDFTGYETQSEGDLLLRMVRIETLLQKVAGSNALTLGLAHGSNFGAGVDLFAACKLRYCTPDASFRMPGLKFGLVLGTRRFRNSVGAGNALSILGTARSFGNDEAVRYGFVERVVDENDWPALIAQAQQQALELDATARTSLYHALTINDDDADMAALVRSASQPGFKQRIRAYLNR